MRMLFHNWIPPPIMITKEKLNTYPPLFNERPGTIVAGLSFCSANVGTFSQVLVYIPFYLELLECVKKPPGPKDTGGQTGEYYFTTLIDFITG